MKNKMYEDENLDALLQEFNFEPRKPQGFCKTHKTLMSKYSDYETNYDDVEIVSFDEIEDLDMFNQ